MPNQHKHAPVSLRLPEADRRWLLDHAKETGIPVNRILADALMVFRTTLASGEAFDDWFMRADLDDLSIEEASQEAFRAGVAASSEATEP